MDFKFHMSTKIFFGRHCVINNAQLFSELGRKAIIVTGASSGKKSGALEDVVHALEEQSIDYVIFDKVENNPTTENVLEGGILARKECCDMVIGIGGGSPLDASKAVAVLAVNQIDPLQLFEGNFENKPLPIAAIPTTAGTGSEVTPYSILTRKDIQLKRSFANENIFPRIAFLDAAYTLSQPWEVTVNTAIDALSHAIEGFLSNKSTPATDALAKDYFERFNVLKNNLALNNLSYEDRENLLYISMTAGMIIAHTGTNLIHPMGYILTYFKDIPHGRANGAFMYECVKYIMSAAHEKTRIMLNKLGFRDIFDFKDYLDLLFAGIKKYDFSFSDEELIKHALTVRQQRSINNSLRQPSVEEIYDIMKKSLH